MKRTGFSLMEMMIVLLIMSIIAAATAPIVSKKMSKSASSSSGSPWVFIDTKGNAAFNMAGKDVTAVIGASKVPNNVSTRLYIDCGNSNSQLTFGKGDEVMQVTADPSGRAGISSATIPNNSIALGSNQTLGGTHVVAIGERSTANASSSVAVGFNSNATQQGAASLGCNSTASGLCSVAIANQSKASDKNAIAIGESANATGASSIAIGAPWGSTVSAPEATGRSSVAIGSGAKASGTTTVALGNSASATGEHYSISIGSTSKASGDYSTAIGWSSEASKTATLAVGNGAKATHSNSAAIGAGARTTKDNQIVLGNSNTTVYIPGDLVVGSTARIGINLPDYHDALWIKTWGHAGGVGQGWLHTEANNNPLTTRKYIIYTSDAPHGYSDRRLKNVGAKYTDGLDALKKLDFYHYTFKKDESKTPHVGVIAQDLQKVFPDAVTKGEDGFLRIRMEDMFYALINAVKELACDITSVKSEIKDLKAQNAELKAQNAELIKRIEKLEKSKKF